MFDPPAEPIGELPFRQVAERLPTPCWISDAEGSIIWVNDAWRAYTGMDVAAIRREGLAGLHDPSIYPEVARRWAEVKAEGKAAEMVFPLKAKDGSFRPFLTRVVPLKDGRGAVTRWFGTNTDIDVQARAEAALKDSESRLALATEAAELGVWDWDLRTNAFVYSPRAKAICGLEPDAEVAYADVVRITHPEDFPRTSNQARRACDPDIRDTSPYEYRIIRPDGAIRWIVAHGRAVFERTNGREQAVRYVGTLQDVTERVNLASMLREKDAILRSLFEAAELFIGVCEASEDGFVYVLANRATAKFYGFPEGAERVDVRQTDLSEEEIANMRAIFLDIWESGAPRTMEYPFMRNGKLAGWYLGTYSPLPAGASGRPRIAFVVTDITDRKQADERQKLLMREIDHRAKNTLAVAQAVVQLTQEQDVDRFRTAVKGRIAALARAHSLLAADRWTGAHLHRLLEEELAPYRTGRPDRVRISGPTHLLPPATAQTFALMLHELATNAAKYGALAQPSGNVDISWQVADNGALSLIWRETGARYAPPGGRKGFGHALLEDVAKRQLGGTCAFEWRKEGLECRLEAPARPQA